MDAQGNKVSFQQSLEQERAKYAWGCVSDVKVHRKEYASLAKSAPADIQINGLGQTLAFWRAKGFEKGQPKKDDPQSKIYEDVSKWLGDEKRFDVKRVWVEQEYRDKEGNKKIQKVENWVLHWIINNADVNAYRRATSETIALLIWIKKFAEAELAEAE